MQTITGTLKNTGVVGAWTDDYGNKATTPRIAIGMRCQTRFKLCTNRKSVESGKLIPMQASELAQCVSYYIAFDSDYLKETDPRLIKTTGITIEVDDEGACCFCGEIPNTAVPSLVEALDASSPKVAYLSLHGEIGGFEADNPDAAAFVSQFEIEVQKRVWMGGNVPDSVVTDPEYWTGAQVEAYLSQTPQVQYSANGTDWHDTQAAGVDEHLRLRLGLNGVWTSAIRIPRGADGKDVYALALEDGFTGTLKEYLLTLKGETGKSVYEIAVETGFTGSEAQFIASLKGGPGKSAYEVAVESGYKGSAGAWLESLKGPPGEALHIDATGELQERSVYNNEPAGFTFAASVTNSNEHNSKVYFYKKRSATSGDWYPPLVVTYYSTPGKDGENTKLIPAVEFTAPEGSGYEYLSFSMSKYPVATIACVCVDTELGEYRLPYDSVYGISKIYQKSGTFQIYFGEHVPTYKTGRVYFTQGLAGLTQYQWYQQSGGTLTFEEWVAVASKALPDAPKNGKSYVRCNGQWVELQAGGGSVTPPPVPDKMYYGYVPYEVSGDVVNVVEITPAMLADERSAIVTADSGALDKTTLGTVPAGALVVVMLPLAANLKALRFDGVGGYTSFAGDNGAPGSGANGASVTLDGVDYEAWGQFNLAASEFFIKIQNKD